jgi:hypothetical protein
VQWIKKRQEGGAELAKRIAEIDNLFSKEPFAKRRFSFKIKACEKFYHRPVIDILRIKL